MTESHNYLVKVRSLLDTAQSFAEEGNIEAAETYSGRAFALMAKYGIEEHMLAAKVHKDEKPIRRDLPMLNPYGIDKMSLLNYIGKALGVQVIRDKAQRFYIPEGSSQSKRFAKSEGMIVLIGFESDIERVEILYTSLLMQSFSEMNHQRVPYGSNTASFRKSFLMGFARIVGERLEEAEKRARGEYEAETGTSTALVMVDRNKRIKDSLSDLLEGRLSAGNKRRAGDGTGYHRGQAAGARADIGGKRLGGNRTQIEG